MVTLLAIFLEVNIQHSIGMILSLFEWAQQDWPRNVGRGNFVPRPSPPFLQCWMYCITHDAIHTYIQCCEKEDLGKRPRWGLIGGVHV